MAALSQERLAAILTYAPETGVFNWTRDRGVGVKAGAVAGSFSRQGYRRIVVDGKEYMAHRLAWLYVHGRFPSMEIDHINRIKDDNRIVNLREASRSENQRNLGASRVNKLKVKGVTKVTGSDRYQATIKAPDRLIYLGCFKSVEEAAQAYKAAALLYHGEFCGVSR